MDNSNTFSLLFYVIKQRRNHNNEVPIYVRITVNGKKTSVSLHRSVNTDLWDAKSGSVKGNTKTAKDINSYILSVQTSIFEHYKYFRESNKIITAEKLKNAFLGKKEKRGRTLIELFEEHNNYIKELANIDYAPKTIQKYNTTLRHVRNFLQKKYKQDDICINELNHQFIIDFELYFKKTKNCGHNTTLKYIKNFRKIIKIAISNGHLQNDPFANFKRSFKSVDKGFLTNEELNAIISKSFKINRLELIRDCFIFSCFTGLSHSDLNLSFLQFEFSAI